MKKNLKDRFIAKVNTLDREKCWEWQAYRNEAGYGKCGTDYAHRVSWKLFRGDIGKFHVCHKCDNPSCVNPNHLFLGTRFDNMQDSIRKGRKTVPKESYYSDERHQCSKFTNRQVRFIRKSRSKIKDLAEKFKVVARTIYCIKTFRTYRDVD